MRALYILFRVLGKKFVFVPVFRAAASKEITHEYGCGLRAQLNGAG